MTFWVQASYIVHLQIALLIQTIPRKLSLVPHVPFLRQLQP